MKWTGWSDFPVHEQMLSAELTPMGEGRPAGLHLSAVIQRMRVAAGEKSGEIPGDQPMTRMQEGFLWETALEYMIGGLSLDDAIELAFKRHMIALRKNITTQTKVEKDGIHMTPDGLDREKGELESYKCTRKSFAKAATLDDFSAHFWAWLVQEQSYAYALGVDTVRWIVLFQAGDYSKGRGTGPRVMQATAVFTADELTANWRMVLANAKGLEAYEEGK